MSRRSVFLLIMIAIMIVPTVGLGQYGGVPPGYHYVPLTPRGAADPPFLFFNETFDQAWYWDPYYRQFRWVPIFPRWKGQGYGYSPPMTYSAPPSATPSSRRPKEQAYVVPDTKMAVGQAVRPIPSRTIPRIVAVVGGKTVTYPIAPMAVILRGQLGGRAVEVALASVRPGDKVTLQLDDEGRVTTLRAQYKLAAGKVKSTAENTMLLETGETVKAGPQTKIILRGNQACCVADVKVGDMVVATVSPVTGVADIVQVQSPAPAPAEGTMAPAPAATAEPTEDDQITLNTLGPLRAGDVLVVRFKAQPGGEAWFTVPGAAANMQMAEVEPGLYSAQYTVKSGDVIVSQPIKVTFKSASGESYTKLSSRLISARTIAGYLPRIISPRQGEEIVSPVVVKGVAEPRSLVRVVIEFRRIAQGIMPITGTTAIEDVKADSSGNWQTGRLAAVMPFSDAEPELPVDFGAFDRILKIPPEPPTVYTITAISITSRGQEKSSYSVDVTKRPGVSIEG